MMRQALLLAALVCNFSHSYARQLSPAESLQRFRAAQSSPSKVGPKAVGQYSLAYTSTAVADGSSAQEAPAAGTNAFYVFNAPQDGGFVILGADDFLPDVLGYSDAGPFDFATAPDALRYWMDCVARDAAAAVAAGRPLFSSAAPRSGAPRVDVAPLCSSLWGQRRPFFNLTPEFNGQHAPAGCVAVSMAQVMYRYKYPERSEGTYYLYSTMTGGTFRTVYDWDSMVDRYGTVHPDGGWASEYCEYSDAARDAVARLLYDLGLSVDMNYSASGSGTDGQNAADALVANFKYDLGLRYNTRGFFSDEEWENMIYTELAAQRPVIYGASTSSREAHSFVLDGYKDGLFHVNWGWEGQGNGYYVITGSNGLRPISQDTKEDLTGDAYNANHHCITGIQPMTPNSRLAVNINYYGQGYSIVDADGTTVSTAESGAALRFRCSDSDPNRNMSTRDVEVSFGARFENVATGQSFYTLHPSQQVTSVWTQFGGPGAYAITTEGLPAGDYRVYYAVKTTAGDWFDVRNRYGMDAPRLTITGTPVDPVDPVDPVEPVDPEPDEVLPVVLPQLLGYTIGAPITDADQLTSGTYFISAWSKGKEGALVANDCKNLSIVPLQANVGKTTKADDLLWDVARAADGTFTLTTTIGGRTLSVMGEQGVARHNVQYVDETSGAAEARFTLYPTTVTIDGIAHWMLYQQEPMCGQGDNTGLERQGFLHCNCTDLYRGSGSGVDYLRLSYWEGSNESLYSGTSCCKFAFYPATPAYDYEATAATVAHIIDRLPTQKNSMQDLQQAVDLVLKRATH